MQIINNQICYLFQDGGWVIKTGKNTFDLFEIPQYGGDERFIKSFNNYDLDLAIKYAKENLN